MEYKKLYPTYLDCKIYLARLVFSKDKISEPSLKPSVYEQISRNEKILQYIWNEGLLNIRSAKTVSGDDIEIINFGRWNKEMGPDFLQAEIKIAGKILKGDVEIHIQSSDWRRHQHLHNNLYKDVILHAFLEKDDKDNYDILPNGAVASRFCLSSYIFPKLDEIEKMIGSDELLYRNINKCGECYPVFSKLDNGFLEHFFYLAGKERIKDKAARFESQLINENADQVFYQAFMTSMGHKGTKALFFLLSKRMPLSELLNFSKGLSVKDRADLMEALLLHIANLVPPPEMIKEGLNNDAQNYLNVINKWWAEFSGYLKDRIIPPTKRWFAGMRPANFPTRRIAGIARFIANNYSDNKDNVFENIFYETIKSQSGAIQNKKTVNLIYNLFIEKLTIKDKSSYWAGRFSFNSNKKSNPQDLIGKNTAKIVLFNSVFPLCLLFAEQKNNSKAEQFLWYLEEHFPALEKNLVVKFMTHRLFGDKLSLPEDFFKYEINNQALLKIFNDACGDNEITCDNCTFKKLII